MAGRSITQRIVLEGGAAIVSQLKSISTHAQEAFAAFQGAKPATESAQRLKVKIDALKVSMKAVADSAKQMGRGFSQIESSAKKVGRNVAIFAAASLGLVGGLAKLVTGNAAAVDSLNDVAASVGLTVKEFQNLDFAAAQSGVSTEQLTTGLTRLSAKIQESAQKEKVAGREREKLSEQLGLGKISIEKMWRDTSIRHGFEEIDGPTFEHLDLYTVKSGEAIVSELFSFTRAGGEKDYALRPEFTPTLARMVAGERRSPPPAEVIRSILGPLPS